MQGTHILSLLLMFSLAWAFNGAQIVTSNILENHITDDGANQEITEMAYSDSIMLNSDPAVQVADTVETDSYMDSSDEPEDDNSIIANTDSSVTSSEQLSSDSSDATDSEYDSESSSDSSTELPTDMSTDLSTDLSTDQTTDMIPKPIYDVNVELSFKNKKFTDNLENPESETYKKTEAEAISMMRKVLKPMDLDIYEIHVLRFE